MTCPNCGSNVRDGARMCLECGEVLRARVATGDRLVAAPVAGVPSWIAFDGETARSVDMPAGRAPRFFAYGLDCIIVGMVLVPLYLMLSREFITTSGTGDGRIDVDIPAWIGIWVVQALYAIVFPATSLQATPGKKLVGLRIVNAYGDRPAIGQTAVRAVVQALFFGGIPLLALGMLLGAGVFPHLLVLALLLPITIPIALIVIVGGGSSPWDAVAGTRVLE